VLVFSTYSRELQTSGAPTVTNERGSPPVFTDRGYVHIIAATPRPWAEVVPPDPSASPPETSPPDGGELRPAARSCWGRTMAVVR
jgi:hypothetical protein